MNQAMLNAITETIYNNLHTNPWEDDTWCFDALFELPLIQLESLGKYIALHHDTKVPPTESCYIYTRSFLEDNWEPVSMVMGLSLLDMYYFLYIEKTKIEKRVIAFSTAYMSPRFHSNMEAMVSNEHAEESLQCRSSSLKQFNEWFIKSFINKA